MGLKVFTDEYLSGLHSPQSNPNRGQERTQYLFPSVAGRFCVTIDDALVDCLMPKLPLLHPCFPVKARPLYGDGRGYKSGAGYGRK